MADRVHPVPASTPPPPPASPPPADAAAQADTATAHPSFHPPPAPAPGAYVIQMPRDQVLRVPPPENARKYKKLRSRPARRRMVRRACVGACAAALLLVLLAVATAGAVYLVFRPRAPSFAVSSLSIRGLDGLNASALSPELNASVRADNGPNRKVGIYYSGGGEVAVAYSGVRLAAGEWPAFYQPPGNVTVFLTALRGKDVRLTEDVKQQLLRDQTAGAVPLAVDVRVPVRARFWKVTTWTVNAKVRCDITVDKLTDKATAATRGCKVKVKVLWRWW